MENFKFGVLNYERTKENHLGKLVKYQKACEETPDLRYDYARGMGVAYKKDNTPGEWAGVIMFMYSGVSWGPFGTKKATRTRVNNFFRNNIELYLRGADLPSSWATAVYLDCYDELNEFMNEVANCIWESR